MKVLAIINRCLALFQGKMSFSNFHSLLWLETADGNPRLMSSENIQTTNDRPVGKDVHSVRLTVKLNLLFSIRTTVQINDMIMKNLIQLGVI